MNAPRHWLDPLRCPACAHLNPSWLSYRPDRDGNRVTCESCRALVLVLLADGRLSEQRLVNTTNTTGGDL
ncbi:hypothetical protein [Actinomadura harenae]|uniref:Uncharacterized protein n=1 Tax=Actinomadura harenae TaxID=2483351 RepID=A0A3M2LKR3_9ACTN|nr:hypothetical protein [Actinomadura harenae]RMI38059.1 hypothetical protein EBO15_34080 [Actinomadura harenae]